MVRSYKSFVAQGLAVYLTFGLFCVVGASDAIDAKDLSARIAAGTKEIWPEMNVDVTIDGCIYRQVKDFKVQDERTEDIVHINLRNVETDPVKTFRDGQLMGDSTGRTWWSYQIVYHWDKGFLDQQAAEIANLKREHDWHDREFDKELSVDPSNAEYEQILQRFSGVAERLFQDVEAGKYGDELAQNYRVTTTWPKAGRNFYLYPLVDINDPWFSHLDFVLNDDVADQILADLHSYVQTHCQE